MFQHLMPLLRHRSVLLTVSHVGEDQVRVNVVPKKIAESENDALTTPMSFTGTAEELDAQLDGAIVSFVASHLELKNTLARAKEEMDVAAKAAKQEATNKTKAVKKPTVETSARPTDVEKKEEANASRPPSMPGLFDSSAPTSQQQTKSASVQASSQDDEERELLAEISADEQVDVETEDEAA
jgi:PRTRC genetic system protein E